MEGTIHIFEDTVGLRVGQFSCLLARYPATSAICQVYGRCHVRQCSGKWVEHLTLFSTVFGSKEFQHVISVLQQT